MENKIESGRNYSTEINSITPSMREIGIGLKEVTDLLENLENDASLQETAKEKIEEADRRVHQLSDIVDKWITEGNGTPKDSDNHLSEKARAIAADENNKRRFLAKIDKAIIESLEGGNIDIQCLTDSLCMSRSTLYRRVKSLTGVSANEYIRRKRMEIAKEMLIDGCFPVSEIAYKVGCSSMSYFRQSFKDIYGVIPSEYLRKLKSS